MNISFTYMENKAVQRTTDQNLQKLEAVCVERC